MVKKYFTGIDVESWVHHRKLGKAERSLCVFHNTTDLGAEILRALDELEADEPPARRTLTFKPVERRRAVATWRLTLVAPSDELRVLHISCKDGVAIIEMTPEGLELLRSALNDWCKGAEDFGVSPRHAHVKKRELRPRDLSSWELWFWGPYYAGP